MDIILGELRHDLGRRGNYIFISVLFMPLPVGDPLLLIKTLVRLNLVFNDSLEFYSSEGVVLMRSLISKLVPPVCLLCRHSCLGEMGLCSGCLMEIPFINENICSKCTVSLPTAGICGTCLIAAPPWQQAYAIMRYSFPVPHLIHRFKFKKDAVAGHVLAKLFVNQARYFIRPDALLAVPLSRGRLRNRGFNQASELARHLSCHLGLPVLTQCVIRRQTNERVQSTLHSRTERKKNVLEVFHVKHQGLNQIKTKHIAIIDDVMTSGATAASLSQALLDHGAKQVDVWVLARA